MTEKLVMMEQANLESAAEGKSALPQPRRSKARRLGCGLGLLFWFTILLTPCALFYLAANGEIRLAHRNIPQPHAHPLLLVALVSETDDRGLRFETSWIASTDSSDGTVCVETTVRFLLWEYSGGNQNVSYCDCYMRQDAEPVWNLVTTYGEVC